MDLRQYDIPPDIQNQLQDQKDRAVAWYQTFIFNDDAIVGTGAAWNGAKTRQYICTEDDSYEIKQSFLTENEKLGNWYSELVTMMVEVEPSAISYIDIGCNAGHFGLDLVMRGKQATGVDHWKECYEMVSGICGHEIEYIEADYSSQTHCVKELEGRTFDYAICSAISTHLSDPHFFLAYASQLASKGMLVTTPIVPFAEPVFRHRITAGRRSRPFPERFEFLPSASAMEMMLQSVYAHVYRRAFQPSDPANTQGWGVWVAQHHPVHQEVLDAHHLVKSPDRIVEFADQAQGLFSIPTNQTPLKREYSWLRILKHRFGRVSRISLKHSE